MNKKVFTSALVTSSLLLTACASNPPAHTERTDSTIGIKKQSTKIQNEISLKSCKEYAETAKNLFNFGASNFYRTYVDPKPDLKGAQGQLFLIEQGLTDQPVGEFATYYKKAEEKYTQNLTNAKKQGCNTSKYPISPVNAFRKGVKVLESK